MKAFLKAGMTALALCAAVVVTSAPALAQTGEDPALVTQAELDLLNSKYGDLLDETAQTMLSQMQTVLRDQAGRMPEDMRPWLQASFEQWFGQVLPKIKTGMAHTLAATLTLEEIENDLLPAPERAEAVAEAQRLAQHAVDIELRRQASPQACNTAPPSGVERCGRIITAINEYAGD